MICAYMFDIFSGMSRDYWMGLTETPNGWAWLDGTPLTFRHWYVHGADDKEPNGTGNCARYSTGGQWKDQFCGSKHDFICEKNMK